MDKPVAAPKTLQEAIQYFANPDTCLAFMVEQRWPDGRVLCPICGSDRVTFLADYRRWKCSGKHPRRQFSIKVGTLFEDSPLGLEKWLPALWMLVNDKNGVSSYEVHRALGVTQKTAWFMLHRLRLAMRSGDMLSKLSGRVEADETFIGPDPRKMHAKRREARAAGRADQGYGVTLSKAIVAGLLDRVKGHVHTNGLENFWSLLKRGLRGTYIAVDAFHLHRYVDEQVFRYNERRDASGDSGRFVKALRAIVGKRLTYRDLTSDPGLATTPA